MKRKMIRVFALLAIICIFILSFSFASAADDSAVKDSRGSGNGWVSAQIIKNNVPYTVYASASVKPDTKAGYTGANSQATLTYKFYRVTYKYYTISDGIITVHSFFPKIVINQTSGESYKADVSSNYSAYTRYKLVTGSIDVIAYNQDDTYNTITLNPQLTGN